VDSEEVRRHAVIVAKKTVISNMLFSCQSKINFTCKITVDSRGQGWPWTHNPLRLWALRWGRLVSASGVSVKPVPLLFFKRLN
jgi:hypothetical protein